MGRGDEGGREDEHSGGDYENSAKSVKKDL